MPRTHSRRSARGSAATTTPRLNRTFTSNDSAVQVPQSVALDILGVVGLDDHFPVDAPADPAPLAPLAGAGPAGGYTPAQLKTAYDVNPLGQRRLHRLRPARRAVRARGLQAVEHHELRQPVRARQPGAERRQRRRRQRRRSATPRSRSSSTSRSSRRSRPRPRSRSSRAPNSDQGVIDTYNAMAVSNTTPANSTSWGLCEPNSSHRRSASRARSSRRWPRRASRCSPPAATAAPTTAGPAASWRRQPGRRPERHRRRAART